MYRHAKSVDRHRCCQQRVALADTHSTAILFRDYGTSEIIHACVLLSWRLILYGFTFEMKCVIMIEDSGGELTLIDVVIILACMAAILISIFLVYRKRINDDKINRDLPSESAVFLKLQQAHGITLLLCGIFLCGLFVFILHVDSEATLQNLLLGFGLGAVFALIGIWFFTFNLKAYLNISNDHIKGRYHWFGKIDCSLDEVDFALAQLNTLIIMTKNGRTHTIMGIKNPLQLASLIRRNISCELTEELDVLIKKANDLKSKRKRNSFYLILTMALMFANIIITVFLTGERNLDEFTRSDWTIFVIMGVIELITVTVLFILAKKTGRHNIPIEMLKHQAQRRVIETAPLLPGKALKVFTDENYTDRITVFGLPNDASVFFTVEILQSDYTLVRDFESELFDNADELLHEFAEWIDITKKHIETEN